MDNICKIKYGVKLISSLETQPKKGQGKGQMEKKQISDDDLEKIFDKRLREDLIDVPEDYDEEDILFKDP